MRKLSFVCVVCASAVASLAWADSITINPDKDNTLVQTRDGSLSNGLGDMFVGRSNLADPVARRRGVIHFNVAGSVPAGSTITSVTLRLWLAKTGDPQVRTIFVHRATASWGEGSSYLNGGYGSPSTTGDATWVHRFHTSSPWTSAGGVYATPASGSASVGSAANVEQWYSWSSAGMKSDVQGWLNNAANNHGWVLVSGGEGTNQTARRFTSREAVDDAGNHFPELIINYTAPSQLGAGAPPVQKASTVAGLRLLGEKDLDGDGKNDLLLRDDKRGVLLVGHQTAGGLKTSELLISRTSKDPLAISTVIATQVASPARSVRLAP